MTLTFALGRQASRRGGGALLLCQRTTRNNKGRTFSTTAPPSAGVGLSSSSSSSSSLSSSVNGGVIIAPSSCSTNSCCYQQRQPAGRRQQQRRFKHSFSSFEYPLATEAPEVTKTTAEEAAANEEIQPSNKVYHSSLAKKEDPFDDAASLSIQQRKELLSQQKQQLNTVVSGGSTAISAAAPPPLIPPNVPAEELKRPETLITELENGIRVVSQETYGQVSTLGVVAAVGSRYEKQQQRGVTNLLELLAFGSTSQMTAPRVTELLQDWGATRFVNTGKEQALYCVDVLRPNVDKSLELVSQVLLDAQFLPEELQEAKRALEFQALDLPPEVWLLEGIQQAAYGPEQQLGNAHFFMAPPSVTAAAAAAAAASTTMGLSPAADLSTTTTIGSTGAATSNNGSAEELTPETIHSFWNTHFIGNPQQIVIAGAGVVHEHFVELAQQHFGNLKQATSAERRQFVPSVYRGGESRTQLPTSTTMDGLTRVALAFPVGGWHSTDLVPTCVLQTLLGGGNSFSAGGPGKGMYSRLYRHVLNRYAWAESAEAFTCFFEESGLWGVSGSTHPSKVRDMVQVLAEHVARLANGEIEEEELSRARNMLKNNVLTQLESRLVLFEDLGRQVLTYGKREDMAQTCARIEAVTAQDVKEIAMRALAPGAPPLTLASVGTDLTNVPRQEEVAHWFRSL